MATVSQTYLSSARRHDLGRHSWRWGFWSWIDYSLTRRLMKVKIRYTFNSPGWVVNGVPQEPVPGPLLFTFFITHIVSSLSHRYKTFAIDVKFYLTFDMFDHLVSDFQMLHNHVNIISQTRAGWGLKINAFKCAVMIFGSKSSSIPNVDQTPYRIDNEFIHFATCYSKNVFVLTNPINFMNVSAGLVL